MPLCTGGTRGAGDATGNDRRASVFIVRAWLVKDPLASSERFFALRGAPPVAIHPEETCCALIASLRVSAPASAPVPETIPLLTWRPMRADAG